MGSPFSRFDFSTLCSGLRPPRVHLALAISASPSDVCLPCQDTGSAQAEKRISELITWPALPGTDAQQNVVTRSRTSAGSRSRWLLVFRKKLSFSIKTGLSRHAPDALFLSW